MTGCGSLRFAILMAGVEHIEKFTCIGPNIRILLKPPNKKCRRLYRPIDHSRSQKRAAWNMRALRFAISTTRFAKTQLGTGLLKIKPVMDNGVYSDQLVLFTFPTQKS